MVTFKPTGRLGNFLFTCAAALVYAKKHSLSFTVPSNTTDPYWNPIYLPHLRNSAYDETREKIIIKEKEYFRYDTIEFREEWREKNIELQGYWQNPKYFDGYEHLILESFNFPWELKRNTCSVHIRRGDYLTLRHKHPEVTVEWILKAMAIFEGHCRFYFFSDDIAWCEQTFGYRTDCDITKRNNEIESLIGISQCENHINSSSTFSWWGAWLNRYKDKMIITPKDWFTPQASNQWTNEVIPRNWIRL